MIFVNSCAMEEGDNDELMPNSDEDWMTENEEVCIPPEKQFFVPNNNQNNTLRSKLSFIGIGFLLIVSSTFLLIALPLYLKAVNVKGDAYTLLLFTSTFVMVILTLLTLLWKRLYVKNDNWSLFDPPVALHYVLKIGVVLGLSSFMIVYAVDRKRVMCHLQDPIKGIILVFSLIFYFFFCRKLMGLQRIFSCTTIIVGLFISVDYGLCDEFRCRGFERETRAGDAGEWTSRVHALWAAVYIFGLALYAAHFTMLERCIVPISTRTLMYTSVSNSLLSTVSRLVSSSDTAPLTSPPARSGAFTAQGPKSALPLNLWLHSIIWLLTVTLAWTDFLPGVGKNDNIVQFWNTTIDGLACHFELGFETIPPGKIPPGASPGCGDVSLYAWPFLLAYLVFSTTTIRFLTLSQSGVFAVAMVTVALPLAGIWWSLFQMTDFRTGLLVWAPSVSGELICSLLGLPIVLLGVALLCKSHFKDISDLSEAEAADSTAVDHEYSSTSTRLA